MDGKKQEFTSLDDARKEIESLRRSLRRKERDNRVLAQMFQNAERIRHAFENEKQLQHLYNDLLLSNTPNMIVLLNDSREYIIGSSACQRLTGELHTDLSLRPLPLLFRKEIDREWVQKINRLNNEVLASLEAVSFQDTIYVEGEDLIHARITISPMIADKRCFGTIIAINDVTELILAQRRAEEAARSKASFLANMSHEIRTPMNAIKGLSELLALTPLNQTQKNYIKNIVGSADSLISVINDVLDFSKIDANRIEIIPVAYSMHKLITEMLGVIGLRAEEKGLSLFLDIDPTIPSRLFGDDGRIKQIILNLISNAIKYTPAGSVVLRIAGERVGPNKFSLTCSVEDTGVGIKPEDISQLFDAFSRVDVRANRSIQGTGLGLAISKRLAQTMYGDIIVESRYGGGSTFTLTLPQELAEDTPLARLDSPEEVRVLLVGSDPRLRHAKEMLDSLGADNTIMETGEDDAELVKFLSERDNVLSGGDTPPDSYSHCIVSDSVEERYLVLLKARMRTCRFGVLRSIINSMEEPTRNETMLFCPLLVTELANFLNQNPGKSTRLMARSGSSTSTRFRVTNAKALVVDDNRINLMVCEKMLSLYGLEVTTASGSAEGLVACMKTRFDVLFIDHMMPEMDGVEMTAAIRNRPGPNRKTPIIALTANFASDMRSYFIKCGMDDYVGKPIDRNDLVRALRQWLPSEKISEPLSKNIG